MNEYNEVAKAYKKLKSSIYFDKTQLPLRNKIVLFEDESAEKKLSTLWTALQAEEDSWNAYAQIILDSISVLVFPKKLVSIDSDTAIFNGDMAPIALKDPQYFIDMSVEGHILSVLWILTIGARLDKNSDETNPDGMYEHSYGNRLRKTLINAESGESTYSPGLFEPYFSQYESWRDYGLEKAKEKLKDNQDALILTLDFKGFYYSVDMRHEDFEKFINDAGLIDRWQCRINEFVFKAIETYSNKLRHVIHPKAELNLGSRNILPIGFLPSNILSNWALTAFDDAIIDKWNPAYYGRYVDDIIIVDKVERNSPIYKLARTKDKNGRLSSANVIDIFLIQRGIFSKDTKRVLNETTSKEEEVVIYEILPAVARSPKSKIMVQNSKVKLFYFQSGSTQALLQCFQTQIAENKSEFRMMPNLDSVLEYRNYSEIFDLRNEDGINKFRGVTGIELDKFALSKFLGKYRKVSGMVHDKEENVFEKDLMLIMDERTLIANYTAWERLFEILIVNNRIKLFEALVLRIIDAISRYEVISNVCVEGTNIHDSLYRVLYSSMCRVLALSWSEEIDKTTVKIHKKLSALLNTGDISPVFNNDFSPDSVWLMRKGYCATRMINKYILPIPVDCVIPYLQDCQQPQINLFSLDDMRTHLDEKWHDLSDKNCYAYHPYMVTPHDLTYALVCTNIKKLVNSFNPLEQEAIIKELFLHWNYPTLDPEFEDAYRLKEISSKQIVTALSGRTLYATEVVSNGFVCDAASSSNKVEVAVGNARILEKDFFSVLDKHPNRTYERYKAFAQMFDTAVKEHVELLVIPENYLPFEWLPVVARLCANNQMALVTGIEHIIAPPDTPGSRGRVYNLTATILPYMHNGYPFANVSYHNKVEYSPLEKEQIEGHGYTFKAGDSYQLFCWKDVWFPVYCCFELASLQDRAIFQSYADIVVAVEWNKDVSYFSNIVESLTRDLHCYCVQANSSDYGDSRVVSPTKSEIKDIIRTKGGRNHCILVDAINIKALRDFQMLGYTLQSKSKAFKYTPPGFDREILEHKRNGTLMDYIENWETNKL